MPDILTKEVEYLLCALYKYYCSQVKNGISLDNARDFDGAEFIQQKILTNWTPKNVNAVCWELHRLKFLNCVDGDDVVYFCTLTDDAIIYMQNRFKNGLKEIFEYMASIKKIIPFF